MRIAIDWARRGRELLILIGIGTFLAAVGPFGSGGSRPFFELWLYWTGLIVLGAFLGELVVNRVMTWGERLPMLVQMVAASLLIAVLMTPVVAIASGGFALQRMSLNGWLNLFVLVWIISAFMTGIGYLMNRAAAARDVETLLANVGSTTDPARTFLERLPVRFRTATLYAISSEDHYLRVHTSLGEELILMRLSDAVRELEGAAGLQTHRSWWVATDAVADTRRENGRLLLVLKSGAEAPVSRTYQPAVRDQGLI